jgi:hypothetical protein
VAWFGHSGVPPKGSATKMLIRSSSGRAIAQETRRRVPTASAWIRSQVKTCGIYRRQSGTGTGFLRILLFPLPILIPPNALYSYHPGLIQ